MIDEAVVESVLGVALRTGGEFAEVFAEDRRGPAARLDDGRVEDLASGRDRGAGIRVVVGETTGFAHTSDLSETGLAGRGGGGRGRRPPGRRGRADRGPAAGWRRPRPTRSASCPSAWPRRRRWSCCAGPTRRPAPPGVPSAR